MITGESVPKSRGLQAIAEAERFFMREDKVHQTLRSITSKLADLGVPYVVVGGMALVAHGYERTTVDVDILVNAEGLARVHEQLSGRGYLPPFEGSRNLRDVTTGVRIEFLIAGQFPGDGKPKLVAFPEPDDVVESMDGICFINLRSLIELKLASGMTNPGRLKDLADVQELIRVLSLSDAFADDLNPMVQPKYRELLDGLVSDRSDEGGRAD